MGSGCASLAGRTLGLEGVARETRDPGIGGVHAAHLRMYKVQLELSEELSCSKCIPSIVLYIQVTARWLKDDHMAQLQKKPRQMSLSEM